MKKPCLAITVISILISTKSLWSWVVSDPTNLFQNTISAISQVQQLAQTTARITREVQALEKMASKIKEFSKQDINNIEELVNQINSFRSRARSIGYTYDGIAQQFDKIYGKKNSFQKNYQAWQNQSDDSLKDAMISQGLLEKSGRHMADLDKIVKHSRDADAQGQEAKLQAIGEINAIQSKQLANLSEIIATDSRAKTSVLLEERSKSQDLKNYENHLMKDFNKHRPSRPLSHLPSLGTTASTR